ncbi:TetR/AcrR family transcriptional regulator [Streptomyces sp. ISL-44]|uniref:TetR/AcrR family transcriptional regulator n=1 Tax=Streptomyces sp. ISL-44 TaxID=2819184 RepID=UPI001BE4FE22|nr:TetR/AcrR family transcriptional regulator [Streptomyces sp. ISL-44]MBT2546739.1 TetR/AcrR family transcriptional regulator [Streptomyces sp. ISL-44]
MTTRRPTRSAALTAAASVPVATPPPLDRRPGLTGHLPGPLALSRKCSLIEQARQAQIIQTTIDVVAEQGYGAASFARKARRRTSISPGLISYHFSTKDSLMRGVLATVEERLDVAMAGTEEDEPETYPDALQGMLQRFAEHCWTHGEELNAMFEIRREARSATVREALSGSHERGTAELVAFIEEGQSHGQFRDTDPALFASVLMSAMGDFPRLRGHSQEEHRRIAVDWASLFVNAISATAGPREDADQDPADTVRSGSGK